MSRTTLLLFALVAILGFGLAYMAVRPMPASVTEVEVQAMIDAALAQETPQLTDDAVRSLVGAVLSEREAARSQSSTEIDADTLNPLIENYLLSNPGILQRVSAALDAELRSAEAEQGRLAIASNRAEIYDDPDNIVLGNPDGDVTLVEMFDYNCGYCRQALPDLATLLAEDPNLRVILKEFPILSQESVDAAKVAVLVGKAGADYWQFHQKLFTNRGRIDANAALAAAKDIGLNPVELQLQMETPAVRTVIDKSYVLANALGISGTPTFIIGDEIIPGAIGIEQLRIRIRNMRECGNTICDPAAATAGEG